MQMILILNVGFANLIISETLWLQMFEYYRLIVEKSM